MGDGEREGVLVTGIAGQVGRHLGRYLRARGSRVVGLDITDPEPDSCDSFIWADITDDPGRLTSALRGAGCRQIVHLAAIVAPTDRSDEEILRVNVFGTYNLLEAVGATGSFERLVVMSSESVLGFAFAKVPLKPLYIPIDETHPELAHDAYGLSKLLAERVCRAFHTRTGIPVVCLRPPWVWIPEKIGVYEELTRDPSLWAHGLWSYIVVDDLSAAVLAAIKANNLSFHCFYVAAPDNGTDLPTAELLHRFYGFQGPIRKGFGPMDSPLSSTAFARHVGWAPRWRWREWLQTVSVSKAPR